MKQKTNGEVIDILMSAFGLELKDLPAFPPKDFNITGFVVTTGMRKIRNAIKEDILDIITKNKATTIKKEILNYFKTNIC